VHAAHIDLQTPNRLSLRGAVRARATTQSRFGGWRTIGGPRLRARLFLQKCEQAFQIGETAALARLHAH